MAKVHLTVRVHPLTKAFYAKFHKQGAGAALDQIAVEKFGVKLPKEVEPVVKTPKAKKQPKGKPPISTKPPSKHAVTVATAAKIVSTVAKPLAAVRGERKPILRPGEAAKLRAAKK